MKISEVKYVDFGCGKRKKDGYFGMDIADYPEVDKKVDLRFRQLPFNDGQLEACYASHFLEHLTFEEAIYFMNEVYRCLRDGGVFEIRVPHAMSYAQYADLSHKSAWTEDTFGYFTRDNKYFYEWIVDNPKTGGKETVINKWIIKLNDSTPPYKYTSEGWVTVKLREVYAVLQKQDKEPSEDLDLDDKHNNSDKE